MGKCAVFGIITAISSAALCAALGLGVFYVRARWEPFPRSDLRMEGDWPLQRDDEIGFVAVKNGRTLRRHLASGLRYHLFTDNLGARVNTPGNQTARRVDLLTIGCSFSWGHGLENEDTFTEGLRRRLGVTVANFAMGSYGTVHSFLLLRRHLDLRPRVVVYGFIDDHLRRNLSPCAPSYAPFCAPVAHVTFAGNGTPAIQPPPWSLFSAELNRRFHEEITMTDRFSMRDVLWRARVDLLRVRESRAVAFSDNPAKRTASVTWLMERLAEEARSVGAALLVAYIPALSPGEAGSPPEALVSAAQRHGATLVDLGPRVRQYHAREPGSTLVLAQDGHPNAAAHALVAEALERVIRAHHLLDEHGAHPAPSSAVRASRAPPTRRPRLRGQPTAAA
jgi:hypothetical protein